MKNGKMATISFYGSYKFMRVTFEDGRETYANYDSFKKGTVRYPDITPASVKKLLNVYKDTEDGRRIALTKFNGYNDVTAKYENEEVLEHIKYRDYRKLLRKNKKHVTFDTSQNRDSVYKIYTSEATKNPDGVPASARKFLGIYKHTKNGRRIALTAFNSYKDVTARHDNGEILEHITFKNYRKLLAKN